MDIGNVIMQIRTYVPDLNARVSGAADFMKAIEMEATPELPHAFVIYLGDTAGENEEPAGLYQYITATIGVVVVVDATADRRGQTGQADAWAMRPAINSAILNWTPPDVVAARGFEMAGSELLHYDRGRLWAEFRYRLTFLVTDSDGWQPPAADFTELGITVTDPDVANWAAEADAMVADGGSGITSPLIINLPQE